MRKLVRTAIVLAVLFCVVTTTVCAQEISADYNFAGFKGFVDVDTEADKDQNISVSIYDKLAEKQDVGSLLWADQSETYGGIAKFGFSLPQDMNEGYYYGKVKDSKRNTQPETFRFYYVNAATVNEFKNDFLDIDSVDKGVAFLKKYAVNRPLLEIKDVENEEYLKTLSEYIIANIQKEKRALDDPVKAREVVYCSQGLVDLNSAVYVDDVDACLKENEKLFGIDINEDYEDFKKVICNTLLTKINSEKGLKIVSEFKELFRTTLVLSVINGASVSEDVSYAIHKYYEDYNIPINEYEKYEGENMNRAFIMKNFKTTEMVYNAYINRKKEIDKGGDESGYKSSGGSVGGKVAAGYGTASGTGGAVLVPSAKAVESVVKEETEDFSFIDMQGFEWANEAVSYLCADKTLNGIGNRLFAPGSDVKREEFVKMIVLAFGLYNNEAKCEFDDVKPDDWFYQFVASAVESKTVMGISDKSFGTGNSISRQDIATIIERVINVSDESVSAEPDFKDMDEVSDYAKSAVSKLGQLGIIKGDNGYFRPNDTATRAEAAVMIYRALMLEGRI